MSADSPPDNRDPPALMLALALARLGFKLIPVEEPVGEVDGRITGKKPLYDGWPGRGTTDEAEIRDWFARWPNCNYGILTGAVALMVVIDVDGPEGEEGLAALERKLGPLPSTREHKTARGRHMFFAIGQGVIIKRKVKLLAKLDVMGDGSQVLGPGAVHPSGVVYETLHDRPVAALPQAWVERLTRQRPSQPSQPSIPPLRSDEMSAYQRGLLSRSLERMRGATPGENRNQTLNNEVYACAQYGLPRHLVEELRQICLGLGTPDREANTTFESAWRAGLAHPKEPPMKVVPFNRSPRGNGTVAPHQQSPEEEASGASTSTYRDWPVLDPKNPLDMARRFMQLANRIHLMRWRGEFFGWSAAACCWSTIGIEQLKSEIYLFLEKCCAPSRDGGVEPIKPKKSIVEEVFSSLQALTQVDQDLEPPAWRESGDRPAVNLIAFEAGLLDYTTRESIPPTPSLINMNAAPFKYSPTASSAPQWCDFLERLWPGDPESIDLLEEWFGYCLTQDTRQQKAMMMIGPKRSGKGTITRVLSSLVGPRNVCSPRMSDLGDRFGLWALIGKTVATISDARVTSKQDHGPLIQAILSITGEDYLTVDRKNLVPWTGRLRTRLMLVSNDLLKMSDGSGALVSRFLVLRMTHSFIGQEDLELENKLTAELPAILNRALGGLDRLRKRGRFQQPQSGKTLIRELEGLTSGIGAFVAECCERESSLITTIDDLFAEWSKWCDKNGRKDASTKQSFGASLRGACPELEDSRPGGRGKQKLSYIGIGLRAW